MQDVQQRVLYRGIVQSSDHDAPCSRPNGSLCCDDFHRPDGSPRTGAHTNCHTCLGHDDCGMGGLSNYLHDERIVAGVNVDRGSGVWMTPHAYDATENASVHRAAVPISQCPSGAVGRHMSIDHKLITSESLTCLLSRTECPRSSLPFSSLTARSASSS